MVVSEGIKAQETVLFTTDADETFLSSLGEAVLD